MVISTITMASYVTVRLLLVRGVPGTFLPIMHDQVDNTGDPLRYLKVLGALGKLEGF